MHRESLRKREGKAASGRRFWEGRVARDLGKRGSRRVRERKGGLERWWGKGGEDRRVKRRKEKDGGERDGE